MNVKKLCLKNKHKKETLNVKLTLGSFKTYSSTLNVKQLLGELIIFSRKFERFVGHVAREG